MFLRWLVAPPLLLAAVAASSDVHPELLKEFRLNGSPLLKGFTTSKPSSYREAPQFSEPAGATAALSVRTFRGPAEIRYRVLLFPTKDALQDWLKRDSRNDRRPLAHPPDKIHVTSSPVSPRLPGEGFMHHKETDLIVNRMLLEVHGFPHPEAIRRDPKLASSRISDEELEKKVRAIAEELKRRAKALPQNRD